MSERERTGEAHGPRLDSISPSTAWGKAAMGGQSYRGVGPRVAAAAGLGLVATESVAEKALCDSGGLVAYVS